MIHDNFAWTFAINDAPTIKYVRDEYIPRLKADINEMQAIVARCQVNGQATEGMLNLQESIGRQKQKLDGAESRLRWAAGKPARRGVPTIGVVLEGGIVQTVVTDQPGSLNLDVTVIDYDTQGMADAELSLIPQERDDSLCAEADSEAWVYEMPMVEAAIDLKGIKPKSA